MAECENTAAGGVDEDGDLGSGENAELAGFFEKSGAAFGEGDLAVVYFFDSFDFDLFPALGGLFLAGGVCDDHGGGGDC